MTFQAETDHDAPDAVAFSWTLFLRDVAIALTAGALCILLASNLADLSHNKTELNQLVARQEATLKGTSKAESQLNSLARGVRLLASGGNPNAQKIVAVLQANGVNIKP